MQSELESTDIDSLASLVAKKLHVEGSIKGSLPSVLFDQSHRQAWSVGLEKAREINPTHPADSSYALAGGKLKELGFKVKSSEGLITTESLQGIDILVLPHFALDSFEATIGVGECYYRESEIKDIVEFVKKGGGLLILGEHEISKYGNNLNQLLANFNCEIENTSVIDKVNCHGTVAYWPLMEINQRDRGVFAGVSEVALFRAGTLALSKEWEILLRSKNTANLADRATMARRNYGEGKVVVITDSDLFGDDSIKLYQNEGLWVNVIASLKNDKLVKLKAKDVESKAWPRIKELVNELRGYQEADGSIDLSKNVEDKVVKLTSSLLDEIELCRVEFPMLDEYYQALKIDLKSWVDNKYPKPDFTNSLEQFHPELVREGERRILAIFPMYTQNGSLEVRFEAVLLEIFWPTWLALVEKNGYDNKGFLTIEFIDRTLGYENHSAVFFPETVSVGRSVKYTWGAIFADREAARYNKIVKEAAKLTKLELPPLALMQVNDNQISREVFALWDLIHDRTHMHGDLPFDPFMIKQRMPYWMYALEELRCDLNSYIEASKLYNNNVTHGALIKYSILFDRIFRFPVTGGRARNYDGLAGQILFSHLHKARVLNWRDNELSFDWLKLDGEVELLRNQIEILYRDGINRDKVNYWLSAYKLVKSLVEPSLKSNWNNPEYQFNKENKILLDDILPDEFPLNLFHEALKNKIVTTVEECEGIDGK